MLIFVSLSGVVKFSLAKIKSSLVFVLVESGRLVALQFYTYPYTRTISGTYGNDEKASRPKDIGVLRAALSVEPQLSLAAQDYITTLRVTVFPDAIVARMIYIPLPGVATRSPESV